MHRHGYQGRKLQLAAGPRKALIRGQVTSLVLHEQITTTLAKAKEIAPRFERLVTKAKKGDLHNKRQIRSFLLTDKATEKLITEIAPNFKDRNGGYTRVVKAGNRRGDNAEMAVVALVKDDWKAIKTEEKTEAKSTKPATAKDLKAPAKKATPKRPTASAKSTGKKVPSIKQRTGNK